MTVRPRFKAWPKPRNGSQYTEAECAAMAARRANRAADERRKLAAQRIRMARAVRADLLSEFCLPANASYPELAAYLMVGRNWIIDSPPTNKDEAVCLVMQEYWDRQRRIKSVERIA